MTGEKSSPAPAAPAATSPAPAGEGDREAEEWEVFTSDKGPFYRHRPSGRKQWERPACLSGLDEGGEDKQPKQRRARGDVKDVTFVQGFDGTDWEQYRNGERLFYRHKVTKHKQWTKPPEVAALDTGAQ